MSINRKDKKKVVIVGGGLAGLSAAYYLSRSDDFNIELYEARDVLGGRVKSVSVDGRLVELGAFMVFPWYKNLNRLLSSLGLQRKLAKLNINHEYTWNARSGELQRVNRYFVFDKARKLSLLKAMPDFLLRRSHLYNPDSTRFSGKTVGEYTREKDSSSDNSYRAINQLLTGYTYASADRLPLSLYFGFAKNLLFHRGFKRVKMLNNGANELVTEIIKVLISRGVHIQHSSQIEVNGAKEFVINNQKIAGDYYIIATAENGILAPFVGAKNNINYTHYYAAIVQTEHKTTVLGNKDWSLVYTSSADEGAVELSSIANLVSSHESSIKNGILTYLRVPDGQLNRVDETKAKSSITRMITQVLPDAGTVEIKHIQFWSNTMPICTDESLRILQSLQGKNGIYFAGDYMGAPSMEAAVTSGEDVARQIIGGSSQT